MDLKDINSMIQKYSSPQAIKDFDAFLDKLPLNVGYNALIAASVVCLMAGMSVWFSAQQLQEVSRLHTELTNVQALQPPVPILKYAPVGDDILKTLGKRIEETFKGVKISTSAGSVKIVAPDTDYFPQFLAAISYLQRGGKNWRVKTESLCVGRDCKADKLAIELKVDVAIVSAPEIKQTDDKGSDKK